MIQQNWQKKQIEAIRIVTPPKIDGNLDEAFWKIISSQTELTVLYSTLNNDGYLDPGSYWQNHNINFNAFSVDLQFVWYFAPGSELSVVWKNNINTSANKIETSYFHNFSDMITSPQTNSFSFRMLYYLDYLYIKKVFTKKK